MASKLAWAGLLGAAADIGKDYVKRERDIEDRKILAEQEARKEQARFIREKALAEWREKLGDEYSQKREGREEVRKKEERTESEKAKIREESRKEEAEKRKEQRSQAGLIALEDYRQGKPTEKEKTIKSIESDEDLSPEEKKRAKMAQYGVTKKEGMSEYQESRLRDQLAKLEDTGIDETNIKQANSLRKQLGEPELVKKVVKPAQKSWRGDTPEEVEWVPKTSEDSSKTGGVVSQEGETRTLDDFRRMLGRAKGGQIGIGDTNPVSSVGLVQQGGEEPAPDTGAVEPIDENKLAQLEKMTMPQLQEFRRGFLETPEANTKEGQEILLLVNRLIQQKGQLGR
jgi:hypothetical protein